MHFNKDNFPNRKWFLVDGKMVMTKLNRLIGAMLLEEVYCGSGLIILVYYHMRIECFFLNATVLDLIISVIEICPISCIKTIL